ncbi:hypothetical protein Q428_00080 [Fervidicella metallireducens AeB]|uniref:2,3-diketo-5-methylthio-1-phosphopentane phosphatase n=1 Tax=Fervidicella metallireducens AeB TaxID=1403537 RepID=A0A017S0Z4_9CLOT|nr:MtnX-like HAD-IB family phosphatase [Fervidicella metallireducens]EYE89850.1 hypothetical protein Q428_00080 [Fervidicella metallireducens AeB]
MKRAFVVDFDGTVTRDDIGHLIIKTFAEEGWGEWEELWIERKITTPMCAEMQWSMVNIAPEDIIDFVKNADFNQGFKEFYEYVSRIGDRIIIASDGFDFYINPILKNSGFDNIEVRCCHLEYKDGWKFSYPNLSKKCGQCGNCKKEIVDKLKEEGYKVYYIGDGYSDRCGCTNADVIFAKSHLARYCEDEKIPHIKFKDFKEIMAAI